MWKFVGLVCREVADKSHLDGLFDVAINIENLAYEMSLIRPLVKVFL